MAAEDSRDNPGVIIFPPLLILIAVVAAVALEFLIPVSFLPALGIGSWFSILGVVLIVVGAGLALASNLEFRRAGTNINPMLPALKLVTGGPYRFSRNPVYLGMLVLLAGIVIAFSLEWGILCWVATALVLHYGVVRREERYLLGKFGEPYAGFLKQTRRWL